MIVMIKMMGGFCKMKNCDASAEIEYLDSSDLSKTEYLKGRNKCSNASVCPYAGECQIFKDAPQIMFV